MYIQRCIGISLYIYVYAKTDIRILYIDDDRYIMIMAGNDESKKEEEEKNDDDDDVQIIHTTGRFSG